ncbi:MAG: FIG019733: possible DNA-binding protein, partial [uncultured Solirubrobacteraceae bacterium]
GPPAADRGQGARRRHRPARRPHPGGLAGLRARQDRLRPRRGPRSRGPADRHRGRRRPDVLPRHRRRDRRPPHARARVLRGQRGPLLDAHDRALRRHELRVRLVRRRVGSREGRHAQLPPGPHQARDRARRDLRAAARPRRARRHRGLAPHGPGPRVARRPHLDRSRAGALGARGAHRARRAARRRGDRRVGVQGRGLPGQGGPQGGRRRRRRRARRRAGGGARGRRAARGRPGRARV